MRLTTFSSRRARGQVFTAACFAAAGLVLLITAVGLWSWDNSIRKRRERVVAALIEAQARIDFPAASAAKEEYRKLPKPLNGSKALDAVVDQLYTSVSTAHRDALFSALNEANQREDLETVLSKADEFLAALTPAPGRPVGESDAREESVRKMYDEAFSRWFKRLDKIGPAEQAKIDRFKQRAEKNNGASRK